MTGETATISLPARFLSAGLDSVPGDRSIFAPAPDSFLLVILATGSGTKKEAGHPSCGQAFLLPSGAPLPDGFRSEPSSHRYWLHFRNTVIPGAAQVCLSLLPIPLPEATFWRISYIFHQLVSESGRQSRSSDLCDFVLSVILLILGGENRHMPRSAVASRMLEYIRLHCCEPLSLSDVSKAMGYSEDYLSRLLHEEVSCSFRQYIHRLRMQRAKKELLSGVGSIREIAANCGYSNAKFFSTSFLKYEGLTPSVFRKLYASDSNEEDD